MMYSSMPDKKNLYAYLFIEKYLSIHMLYIIYLIERISLAGCILLGMNISFVQTHEMMSHSLTITWLPLAVMFAFSSRNHTL